MGRGSIVARITSISLPLLRRHFELDLDPVLISVHVRSTVSSKASFEDEDALILRSTGTVVRSASAGLNNACHQVCQVSETKKNVEKFLWGEFVATRGWE
jgi:hypothetical protein